MMNSPMLKAVLTYHVVEGKPMASDIISMKRLTTVEGEELKIDASTWHGHSNPKVNDANIIQADVIADNGVIHVIDKVLMTENGTKNGSNNECPNVKQQKDFHFSPNFSQEQPEKPTTTTHAQHTAYMKRRGSNKQSTRVSSLNSITGLCYR
jgi:hypothetical protein